MKKIKHIIELITLIAVNIFVLLLPLNLALWFARRLGDVAFYIVRIRRKIVLKNLSLAFPNKSYSEIFDIARKTYLNFAMSMIELLSFPKIKIEEFAKNNIEYEGWECLDNFVIRKKGAILIAGHFGSWELMGAVVLSKGYPLDFLIGKQHNIYVDNLLNFYRRQKNMGLIPLDMALKGVLKAVKSGRFVAMIADQDAGKRDGVFVNFFGKAASTPKGPAVFVLRGDIPAAMGFCIRQGFSAKHKIKFVTVDFNKTGDYEKDVELFTSRYTQILEDFVRKYPDQWFWFHKRWKTVIDNTANMY
jgi:Kdo2-lipid IVA lauroyltransferase/acyltransferase